MKNQVFFAVAGEQVGEVELSESVFGAEPNGAVLHESVKNHLANRRQGTQSALTKGEVSYSTKKPWRQKGTGRARAGYKGSPVWTHGGVAFAPKPRDYRYTLNRKVRKLALVSALSAKAAEDAIIVVDDLNMDTIKTKDFQKFLTAVGAEGKVLVVAPEIRENVIKSARNIPGVKTTIARKFEDESGKEQRSVILSAYDVLDCRKFIIDEAALKVVEEVYA